MTPFPLTLAGLGAGLPSRCVGNDELAQSIDTSDEWIKARTGISTRYIQTDDKAMSHLAIEAGKQALDKAQIKPNTIDLVVVATMTPDTYMPATACKVAHALGCTQAGAVDINIACSGFLYALLTSAAQLQSGHAKRILCIGGDTLSRITNWADRRTAVLFGDACGAAVLTLEGDGELLGWDYGADGSQGPALAIAAGPGIPSQSAEDYKVTMDGRAVFRFATQTLVKTSERALEMAGIDITDIDLIVPHQANKRILDAAAKKWNIPIEKFMINLDRFGNSSAGSIPLALFEAVENGRIPGGGHVLLCGFGGGLSWASLVLKWTN